MFNKILYRKDYLQRSNNQTDSDLLLATKAIRDDCIISTKYSKEKTLTLKLGLYSQKQYYSMVSKINTFSNRQRLRKFST